MAVTRATRSARGSRSKAGGDAAPADGEGGARRPASYILDLYGSSVRHELGTWISVAALIDLMADLDVDAQAVRSALSRMKQRSMVQAETRERRRGYALTEGTLEMIREGDARIFHAREPARLEDGWVLAVFSVPEADRAKRHLLRSRLEWLGFGNQAPGVWIAPVRLLEDARRLIARLDLDEYVTLYRAEPAGLAETRKIVEESWDLARLESLYTEYVARHAARARRVARTRRSVDPREAFVEFIPALHEWRKFPYLDPGLPVEVLPRNWSARRAADIFFSLRERLEPTAAEHMRTVMSANGPPAGG